jgi:hypothetical protein
MDKPRVLVVEKDPAIRAMQKRQLADDFDVSAPCTPWRLKAHARGVDAIVVCCIKFSTRDIVQFVCEIAPSFRGPIVVISRHSSVLLEAGGHLTCTNWELPGTLKQCLGMNLATPVAA